MRETGTRIGGPHNFRRKPERGIIDFVAIQDCVEAHCLGMVPQFAAGHIEYSAAGNCRPVSVTREKCELSIGIDKAPDQPRTGNPVDLYSFSCDPLHLV